MKIVFLTSCLEPGRDGVGDYTRLLAAECERAGHSVRLLALNDIHTGQVTGGHDLLRLPASLSWKERQEQAREVLTEFAPDFVSLQFVCYGYHPRGIDWQLAGRLKKITRNLPVQIMLHELWIGAEKGAPLKARVMGAIQRRGVMDVIRTLAPRVVHTSNPAYIALLQARGVRAERLPLFGSIPVLATAPDPVRENRDTWTFGLFGTLHPVWPPEPLFARLRETGKKIVISQIGRLGSGEALWEKITRDYAGVFEFRRMGEQTPEKIAEIFTSLDFGVATSPWELIGKSAAVAAMLEHGLPVIVNRDDVHYHGWQAAGYSPQLIKMTGDLPERLAALKHETPFRILPGVAQQFLDDLGGAA